MKKDTWEIIANICSAVAMIVALIKFISGDINMATYFVCLAIYIKN